MIPRLGHLLALRAYDPRATGLQADQHAERDECQTADQSERRDGDPGEDHDGRNRGLR